MEDFARYDRQMLLPGFGKEKQQSLKDAKVLVVGAGGLGSPVLQYLTAAGVGTLGIVDDDVVELTNLHRQILFSEDDIGQSKAIIAANKLQKLNQQVLFIPYNLRLVPHNIVSIFKDYDLVIDGSDNFPTRYLVNDACVLLEKPLIYGSIYRFEGQVAVFNFPQPNGKSTNYRDIFPHLPNPKQIPNCAEAGVLGVLPGIIGSLQANEAIKILTGMGKPLVNQLLTFNSLTNSSFILDIFPNPESDIAAPKNLSALSLTDYEVSCGLAEVEFLEASDLESFILSNSGTVLLDIREAHETPKLKDFQYISIPLNQLQKRIHELNQAAHIVVFCQSGTRSRQASEMIKEMRDDLKVIHLEGGINKWVNFQNEKR